jgi:C4-dicarboxylate transporter DctM subunit
MSWSTIILITVAVLIMGLASGMRIVFVLTLVGILVLWTWLGINQSIMLGILSWNVLNSISMTAIPLFVFMGMILFKSKLTERVYGALTPIFTRLPGGLLQVNIALGSILAAACGSSMATTAMVGVVSLPEMERQGYDRSLAVGSVMAGGSLGILIPPSVTLIIYGVMVSESVGKLFIAGIFPGIMLAALYMLYIAIRVRIQPHLVPIGEAMVWSRSLGGLIKIWPLLAIVILVFGSIYGGVATASEAGAVGCISSLALAAVFRELNWKMIKDSTLGTVKITSMCVLLLLGAQLMGMALINLGIFTGMVKWVVTLPIPPLTILIAIYLMYFILGCFMSGLPAVIITLPITFPIIVGLGYDPIWFGIVIVLFCECGLLTPPVGALLFIVQGLSPNRPFSEVMNGATPFVCIILLATIILTAFPQIATFLPQTMFK